jgi:hypothetical protein
LPEDDAPIVEKIAQKRDRLFEIEVNITKNYIITPTQLFIDGEPWQSVVEEYKANNKDQ